MIDRERGTFRLKCSGVANAIGDADFVEPAMQRVIVIGFGGIGLTEPDATGNLLGSAEIGDINRRSRIYAEA